eukprot:728274-Amphidinium_carterae.1
MDWAIWEHMGLPSSKVNLKSITIIKTAEVKACQCKNLMRRNHHHGNAVCMKWEEYKANL